MAVTTDPKITGVLDVTSGTGIRFSHLGVGAAVAADEIVAFTLSDSIASAASAVWNGLHVNTSTATISGSTNITTANGFNLIQVAAPALVGTITVTNAASFTIIGAPTISGGGAITNADAFRVVGGTSRFGGALLAPNGTAAAPSYAFSGSAGSGLFVNTVDATVDISVAGTRSHGFGSSQHFLLSDAATIQLGAAQDVILARDAAAILSLKNGTTAQTLRVYGTTTGSKYASLTHNATNGIVASSSGDILLTAEVGTGLGWNGTELYPQEATNRNLGTSSLPWTNVYVSAGAIITDTTTGLKIGTGTTQKISVYNATPVVQGASVADATDAATAITQLNALISRIEAFGIIATV